MYHSHIQETKNAWPTLALYLTIVVVLVWLTVPTADYDMETSVLACQCITRLTDVDVLAS